MRMRTGAAVVAAVGLAVGLALAQPEKKPPAGAIPAAQPAEQQPPKDPAASPGPEHQRLGKLAGNFTAESTYTGMGPEPQKSTGAARAAVTLGGRFLEITETGTMMGEPFESVQIWGYNRASKKYESVWRYTMSTSIMTMRGESKDGGKTIACDAAFDGEGGKPETMKVGFKHESDDRFVVTLTAAMPDGQEVKMETVYTRKK